MVFLHDSELSADMMEDAEENAGLTLQEMSGRVEELEKQLSQTKDALHTAEKAVRVGQAELVQAKAEASSERQELIDLQAAHGSFWWQR